MSTPANAAALLTSLQQATQAINALVQTYLNVNGSINSAGITVPTQVKVTAGRLATVSVIVAGTGVGMIYDSAQGLPTKPLTPIPTTLGPFEVNLPTSLGLYVVPGAGQSVTVGYS